MHRLLIGQYDAAASVAHTRNSTFKHCPCSSLQYQPICRESICNKGSDDRAVASSVLQLQSIDVLLVLPAHCAAGAYSTRPARKNVSNPFRYAASYIASSRSRALSESRVDACAMHDVRQRSWKFRNSID